MKIRVICNMEIVHIVIKRMEEAFKVLSVSDAYPCRNSDNVRLYFEVEC